MSFIVIVTCLPVVYYGYLQFTMSTCSLLYMSTCSLLWLPVVYHVYLQSTMSTCSLLCLPHVVYYVYLQSTFAMATCSLLWLYVQHSFSVVQSSIHSYSTLPTQSLFITASLCAGQSALPIQLAHAIVCSAYPQLYILSDLYMIIQFAMPKQSFELPIAFYTSLVSFSNIRSILSNRTYGTEFVVSSYARFNKIKQR